jgi:hypothetical protein
MECQYVCGRLYSNRGNFDRGLFTLVSAVIKVPWLILVFVFASYAIIFGYSVVMRIVRRLWEVIY